MTSKTVSSEEQRRQAFANFLAALDAKDIPVSMAAAFQSGWDACMRRERPAHETTVALSTYESAVKGRQDFRAALVAERSKVTALRTALEHAVQWGGPMAEAPRDSRPAWFDIARAALAASSPEEPTPEPMKCAIDKTCLEYPRCRCGTLADQARDIESFARCVCLRHEPCPIHPSPVEPSPKLTSRQYAARNALQGCTCGSDGDLHQFTCGLRREGDDGKGAVKANEHPPCVFREGCAYKPKCTNLCAGPL